MADFRLLGPVEVWAHDRALDVGTTKQQAVLACLLLDAGRPVTAEALIDRVWGEAPPASVRATLQSHLSRIRRLLAAADPPAELHHRSGAYRLLTEPGRIDLHHARRLAAAARAADVTDQRRVELLRTAGELWRGEPLSGLPGPWLAQMRDTLRRTRTDILVDWAAARLRLGQPDAVIDAARARLLDDPLVEPLVGVLLRALVDAGRDAEALTEYEATRRRLADEYGADPSADLQELYRSILAGTATRAAPRAALPAKPAHLPADAAAFTGRTAHLAELDRILAGGGDRLVVVAGAAGIGKTALVVRWAHRVADRFPDGQLYVNLHGYAADPPASPTETLRGFLEALGVAHDRMPTGLTGLTGRYRSLLADRRMLVVLDNARDADQVRPLLPGSPASMVVTTSRNQLPGLIASDGAIAVPLAEPSPAEARELLARRIGTDRVAAEPSAVEEIIAGCGRLPLALSVLAARAALRPDFPLGVLAAELRDGQRLDALDIGDGATDARAAFTASYAALGDDARRVYRLAGLYPGPELPVPAAANLAGWPADRTRRSLAELGRAHLATEVAPGRYTRHDLLREHAAELADRTDTAAERSVAVERYLDGCLATAHASARLLDPHREQLLDPPDVPAEEVADRDAALDWLTRERDNLVAALHMCVRLHLDRYAWHLAWCLYTLYSYRGDWAEQVDAQRLALSAAQRWENTRCEAFSWHALGASHQQLGQVTDAQETFRQAIARYEQLGDPAARADAHSSLAWLCISAHDHRQALDHMRRVLAHYERTTDRRGVARTARALETIGWCHVALGEPTAAVEPLRRALDIEGDLGDRGGQAATLDTLGDAYSAAGEHEPAIASYERAIELTAELGDRYHEAVTRRNLGAAYRRADRPDDARTAWKQALAILDDLHHEDAESLRTDLDAL
ncbi:MAG TPA: BTAD domain-containing putative transcriptional regulator [Actinocatenispora sp.]